MQPEQPQSMPPTPPQYPQMPLEPLPSPPRRKWPLIIALAVAGLIIAAVATWLLLGKNAPKTTQGNVSVPTKVSGITESDVAKLDKDASFWGYFKNAAMQQQLVTEHKNYSTQRPTRVDYRKLGFDYQTKKLVAAIDEVTTSSSGGYRSKNRCYDGKNYYKTGPSSDWRDVTPKSGKDAICDPTAEPLYYLTDGTNAGGLTEVQADTFVNYLRGKQGLANVRSLALVTHAGKQYLHYVVDFVPIPTYNDYGGNYWFMEAIKAAGVGLDKLPYGKSGVIGGGTHLEYYVDPTTSLPAYSKTSALPPKGSSGKDEPLDDFEVVETLYHFGTATFDVATSNDADLTFSW